MSINSAQLKAHLAMFAVAVFYGVNYFTLKEVFNEGYSSFALLAIRCMAALAFFVPFYLLFIKEKIKSRKDYGRLMLCALFGISINQIFFLWGLSETSRVNSAVLMITTPVFVFMIARLLKQETFNWVKIGGLLVSFAGALTLILAASDESVKISGSNINGDIMIMGNAASYGLYLVLVRPLVLKYNTFTIITWMFIFGSIPNLIVGMPFLLESDFSHISGLALFGIIYLIVFATIGAYFLNAWSMKVAKSSAVGAYIYVQPVFVTVGSAIFYEGEVDLLKVLCIMVIFLGVYLVSFGGKKVKKEGS